MNELYNEGYLTFALELKILSGRDMIDIEPLSESVMCFY